MTSVLYKPIIDSARALSQESPTDPTDGVIPAAVSSRPYRMARYSLPASEWWTAPATVTPSRRRAATAMTRASSTRVMR